MDWIYVIWEWFWKPENLTAISTLAIAAFTVVLAWVGYCQARLIRKSIDLARQEFIATHRPKIIVRFIQGPFNEPEDGRQFAWLTLVNVGETRGTIVGLGRDLARRVGRGGWLPPGLAADLRQINPVVLESGDRFVVDVRAQTAPTDSTIAEDIWPGVELCAVGVIQYRDDNGKLLETGFLRIWDESDGFVPSKNSEDEISGLK